MSARFQPREDVAGTEGRRQEVQLAVFRVGVEMYAIDIMAIREIIRPQKLTAVPNAPAFIEGVIHLRGAIIPVMDLRRRFRQAAENDRKTRIIVCIVEGKIIGFTVDEVLEVRRCTRADIHPAPQYLRGRGGDFFLGVCRRGEELAFILNVQTVLSSREMIDLEAIEEMHQTLESTQLFS